MQPDTRLSNRIRFESDLDSDAPLQTLAGAWRIIARHAVLLVALPLAVAIIGGVYTFTRPRTYTSSASFMGSSPDVARGGLTSLASQFGLRVPVGDAGQSPQFYADLLHSRQVLDSVVQTRFTFHDADGRMRQETLLDAFHVSGATQPIRVENAMAVLDRITSVAVGNETGVVRLAVSTTSPELSMQIAARFLHLINTFNLDTRQSQARAEREFTEARMADAAAQLHAAEDRLAEFRRQNHSFGSSSELVVEEDRLQRDVSLRAQLYSAVAQAYEQARVDEVRNTPVITTVESPYLPARPDGRGLLRRVILGAVLGGLLALVCAVVLDLRALPEPVLPSGSRVAPALAYEADSSSQIV